MAFHCTNCNGSLTFDVSSQSMRCAHCGSTFDPQDFQTHDNAVLTTSITCQNCGAELEGTDDSLVGFCPYCGGQSLVTRPGEGFSAEKIIPFAVDRDQCAAAYASYARHIPYLHKEFKDPEHIRKFTGIYMPYYQYDATFDIPQIEGKTSEEHARYTEITDYRIDVKMEGDYEHGTPFDASRYLDDEISARCMPFDVEKERPFRPAYLAGFYADTSTVPAELYYEDAQAQAEQDLLSEIDEQSKANHGIPITGSSRVSATVTNHHAVLFPLWFLTWRKDDRVAYVVVNGESGQVVSDLPLDIRAFAVGSVIISAVMFALMELLFQPTPGLTAFVSFVAAALMAWGIHTSAKLVHDRQTHAQDKGWTKRSGVNSKPIGNMRGPRGVLSTIAAALPLILFGLILLMRTGSAFDLDIAFDSKGSLLMKAAPIVVLGCALFVLAKVMRWNRELKDWNAPLAIGALVFAVLVNAIIIFWAPVNDAWYYLGDIVCIVGLIVSSIGMIRVYNIATTRPLPKLFDREEV